MSRRMRSSLDNRVPSERDERQVQVLADEVYHLDRGVFFSKEQLEGMPWDARELIKSEARRIYGKRRG